MSTLTRTPLLFFTYVCAVAAQQKEGILSLWSDSGCNSKGSTPHFSEPDPIALNFTLGPDTCGVAGAAVHSYKIQRYAVCDDGVNSGFTYWDRDNCTQNPTDENPDPARGDQTFASSGRGGREFVDQCLALTAFNSFVFYCAGVSERTKYNNIVVSSPAASNAPYSPPSSTEISPDDTPSPLIPTPTTGSNSSNQSITTGQASPPVRPPSPLTAGESAGIGVGTAFGTLALLILSAILWLKWRRAKSRGEASEEVSSGNEVGQMRFPQHHQPNELEPRDRRNHELPSHGGVGHEVSGVTGVYEVPAPGDNDGIQELRGAESAQEKGCPASGRPSGR